MSVDIIDTTDSKVAASVRLAAERLLELLDCADNELSVLLCDDSSIRALNRDWRGTDRATDVLSFSQLEGTGGGVGTSGVRPAALRRPPGQHLGDVVISVDTARRQALEGDWTLEEEVNRLLLHGVLHLLGYEHEHGGLDEARMRAEEARLSAALLADGMPCARDVDAGEA